MLRFERGVTTIANIRETIRQEDKIYRSYKLALSKQYYTHRFNNKKKTFAMAIKNNGKIRTNG